MWPDVVAGLMPLQEELAAEQACEIRVVDEIAETQAEVLRILLPNEVRKPVVAKKAFFERVPERTLIFRCGERLVGVEVDLLARMIRRVRRNLCGFRLLKPLFADVG